MIESTLLLERKRRKVERRRFKSIPLVSILWNDRNMISMTIVIMITLSYQMFETVESSTSTQRYNTGTQTKRSFVTSELSTGSDTYKSNTNDYDSNNEYTPTIDQNLFQIIPASWIIESSSSSTRTSRDVPTTTRSPQQEYDTPTYTEMERNNDSTNIDENGLQLPNIQIHDMASILHYTSYMNEQIQHVCGRSTSDSLQQSQQQPLLSPPQQQLLHDQHHHHHHHHHHHRMDHIRGGGGTITTRNGFIRNQPYRIPYTRNIPQHPTLLSSSSSHSTTTMKNNNAFHCHDYNQYGNLYDFLSKVITTLHDCSETSTNNDVTTKTKSTSSTTLLLLERTLMMIYLDRACSTKTSSTTSSMNAAGRIQPSTSTSNDVDTNHYTNNSNNKLPFCTPSTIHYLCITAMLVAIGVVRGDLLLLYHDNNDSNHNNNENNNNTFMNQLYHKLEITMGIPIADSRHRVSLMLNALKQQQPKHTFNMNAYSSFIDDNVDDYYYDDIDNEQYDGDDDDSGMFVTPDTLHQWKQQWEAKFLS